MARAGCLSCWDGLFQLLPRSTPYRQQPTDSEDGSRSPSPPVQTLAECLIPPDHSRPQDSSVHSRAALLSEPSEDGWDQQAPPAAVETKPLKGAQHSSSELSAEEPAAKHRKPKRQPLRDKGQAAIELKDAQKNVLLGQYHLQDRKFVAAKLPQHSNGFAASEDVRWHAPVANSHTGRDVF